MGNNDQADWTNADGGARSTGSRAGSATGSVDAITRPVRRVGLWAIALALVGAALGLFVHSWARADEDERVELAFYETLTERGSAIEKDVLTLGEVLHSLHAFYASSDDVKRTEFASFVQGPLRRLPDVRAVAWAPLVRAEDVDEFVEDARENGVPDFEVVRHDGSAVPSSELLPILYLHPALGNELEIGFDLGSHSDLGPAISRARLDHEPRLSDPVQFGADTDPLTLMFLGVFDVPEDGAVRALEGFVVLAFRPADICERALSDGAMFAQLVGPGAGGTVLFSTPGFDEITACCSRPVQVTARHENRSPLEWRLHGHPTPKFVGGRTTMTPLLLGAIAALLSWGIGAAVLVVVARARSQDIKRQDDTIGSVLENLSEGVVVFDRDGVILFSNPASRHLFGGADDLQRSGLWTSADGCYLSDRSTPYPAPHLPLVRTLRGEVVAEEEIFVRSRAGAESRWVGVSGAPLRGPDGEVQGGVLVFRDVTAQRSAKEQRIEMELASDVQTCLYPAEPKFETLDLSGAVFSADATCGDYYDFIQLSDDRVAIAIGDVSGHGLGPAMIMTQVRAYLRAFAQMTDDYGEVVARVNRALVADLREEDFVTLLVAFLDLRTHRIHWVNAGHVPGYVLDSDGQERAKLDRTGMAMGIDEGATYGVGDGLVLEKGDVAVFLTDGVIESRTRDGAMLWDEGALQIVRKHMAESPSEIIRELYARVRDRAVARRRKQEDDVTMVILKATSEPAVRSIRPVRDPLRDSDTAIA